MESYYQHLSDFFRATGKRVETNHFWADFASYEGLSVDGLLQARQKEHLARSNGLVLLEEVVMDYICSSLKLNSKDMDLAFSISGLRTSLLLGAEFRIGEKAPNPDFMGVPIMIEEAAEYCRRINVSLRKGLPFFCEHLLISEFECPNFQDLAEYTFERYKPEIIKAA